MNNPIGVIATEAVLKYKEGSMTDYVVIPGLQEIPEMGGSRDKVEVTTLSDKAKRSIFGIKDYGDLGFKFLYDNSTADSNYRVLRKLGEADKLASYQIEYPDGTTASFDAFVSVKLDSVKVNGALTFTATMMVQTDIEIVDPVAGA